MNKQLSALLIIFLIVGGHARSMARFYDISEEKVDTTFDTIEGGSQTIQAGFDALDDLTQSTQVDSVDDLSNSVSKLRMVGAAVGVLGFVAVIYKANDKDSKSDLGTVLDSLSAMEENLLSTMGQRFDEINDQEQKNIYIAAERRISSAGRYLKQMQEVQRKGVSFSALPLEDQADYNLAKYCFEALVGNNGLDDLETMVGVFEPKSAFLDKNLINTIVSSPTGKDAPVKSIKAIVSLCVVAYLNRLAYLGLEDTPKNRILKDGLVKYFDGVLANVLTQLNNIQADQAKTK